MKYALLVGITYNLSEQKSLNIIKSIKSIQTFLETQKYHNIHTLSCQATRQDIINGFNLIIKNLTYDDELWFHFIGHSLKNEKLICPYNYREQGVLTENDILNQFIYKIPFGVRCYMIIDTFSSCGISLRHSIQDHSYALVSHPNNKYNYREWELQQQYIKNSNYKKFRADIYLINLKLNTETLLIYPLLTTLLIKIISIENKKWKHLIKDISCSLKLLKYKHNVQLFSGNYIDINSLVLSNTNNNDIDLNRVNDKIYISV